MICNRESFSPFRYNHGSHQFKHFEKGHALIKGLDLSRAKRKRRNYINKITLSAGSNLHKLNRNFVSLIQGVEK